MLEGEKAAPEATFAFLVVEGRGEWWEAEAGGPPRPGERDAFFGFGEGVSGERMAYVVDLAGRARADGDEELRVCGEQRLFEEACGRVSDVGVWEAYGAEARAEGFQDAGADGLFDDEDHADRRVA